MKPARSTSRLQYAGLPWIIIKPTKNPPNSRPISVVREVRDKNPIPPPPPQTTKRLPFLSQSTIGFDEDEISTINGSLNMDIMANPLQKSPSRLQQIKLTHFESAQRPLAMDIEPSLPYIMPTAAENALDLERDPSLISLHGDEDLSAQLLTKSSAITATPSAATFNDYGLRDEPVSASEVQNQVWIYCNDNKKVKGKTTAHLFTASITDNVATLSESKGRKRLLGAIHKVADSSGADYYEPVKERKINKPIENTYTAQRLSLFLEKRHVPIPEFLEPNK